MSILRYFFIEVIFWRENFIEVQLEVTHKNKKKRTNNGRGN
jgi:hypothetical protein